MVNPLEIRPPSAERRIKRQGVERSKRSRPQGSLLREEAIHRRAEPTDNVDIVRAEPRPVVAEAEEERPVENTIGPRSEFVTRQVNPEVVKVLQPDRIGQQHGAAILRAQAEFAGGDFLPGPTDRRNDVRSVSLRIPDAEVRPDDQDVGIGLALHERASCGKRTGQLAQMLLIELPLAVVVELAATILLDGFQHFSDFLAVLVGEEPRADQGESAFHPTGMRQRGIDLAVVPQRGVGVERGPVLAQDVDLVGDRARSLVAGEIAVARPRFLVLVLVRTAAVVDEVTDHIGQARCVVDPLGLLLGEASFVVGRFDDRNEFETFRISRRH